MKKMILFFMLVVVSLSLFSQDQEEMKGYVTLLSETNLTSAIRSIEVASQKETGKKIINLSSINPEIGFPVNDMYWKDALHLLVKLYDLEIQELPGVFKVMDKKIEEEEIAEAEDKIKVDSKQVKISATFFQATKDIQKSVGIDWSTVFNGEVNASVNFNGASGVTSDIMNAAASTTVESGDLTIDINTLLKILESHEQGSVIARPNITVVSGKKGFIQVGSDFSIKTLDDAGNVADKFFSTGIILEVTPKIIEKDGIEAIHLEAKVENSAVVPGQERTTIGKSTSDTDVLLFDGETTVMGGLYNTDYTVVRNGIPILKDLPWWVLGIKYITGVNRRIRSDKEMIVILKAEIVEPVEQRMQHIISAGEKIENYRKTRHDEMKIFNSTSFEE